jgi:cytochrome b
VNIRGDAAGAGGVMPPATSLGLRGADAAPPTVPVWDPFVRVFHWSLVGLFALAFATGDEIEWLHLAAGYAIAGLVALRLAWGFVGPEHARFGSFVRSPREIWQYLRDAARLRAPRHLGHNPAGGAMIVALLVTLAGTAATGFMMTTDAYWGAQWVENLHEALANGMLVLIGLHVAGVIVAGIVHGENLVRAMITGRKRAP